MTGSPRTSTSSPARIRTKTPSLASTRALPGAPAVEREDRQHDAADGHPEDRRVGQDMAGMGEQEDGAHRHHSDPPFIGPPSTTSLSAASERRTSRRISGMPSRLATRASTP